MTPFRSHPLPLLTTLKFVPPPASAKPASVYGERRLLPADLDWPETPAVPCVHAALHNVAATVVIVGIVGDVVWIVVVIVIVTRPIEPADENSSPTVETLVETAVAETIACKTIACKATALNSRGNSRRTDRS